MSTLQIMRAASFPLQLHKKTVIIKLWFYMDKTIGNSWFCIFNNQYVAPSLFPKHNFTNALFCLGGSLYLSSLLINPTFWHSIAKTTAHCTGERIEACGQNIVRMIFIPRWWNNCNNGDNVDVDNDNYDDEDDALFLEDELTPL